MTLAAKKLASLAAKLAPGDRFATYRGEFAAVDEDARKYPGSAP